LHRPHRRARPRLGVPPRGHRPALDRPVPARVTALSWVAFDVGETLVDETRMWGERADRLGIPRLGFFAALGAVIEARRPHREVYALLGHAPPAPDDWWADLRDSDLYPDAAPTLAELRRGGAAPARRRRRSRRHVGALGRGKAGTRLFRPAHRRDRRSGARDRLCRR